MNLDGVRMLTRRAHALRRSRFSAVPVRRSLAVLIGLAGAVLAARYPLGSAWGISAFCAATALFYFNAGLWIWAVPIVIVIGDLYPWTGSLLFNETDLALLAVLAVLFWRTDAYPSLLPKHKWTWVLWLPFAVSAGLSCIRGWQLLPPSLPGDALSIYCSEWNTLRVAKGFAWGIILAQLLAAELQRRTEQLSTYSLGMQTSAFLVAVVVLYERAMAVGIFNIQQLYRATGPFFSMHTGGQHIDAFWAIALPFLFLPPARGMSWPKWLIRIALLAVSLYAITATMSRGIIVWAGIATVGLALVLIFSAQNIARRRQAYVVGVAALLSVIAVGVVLLKSDPIHARFEGTRADLTARWNQWKTLCRAADRSLTAKAIGNGMGTVPSIAANAYDQPLQSAELVSLPDGRIGLRLRPGKKVFVEQSVDRHAPGPWRLKGLVRGHGGARLNAHVCEKTLFDSFRCVESSFPVAEQADSWQTVTWTIDTDELAGPFSPWLGCPVSFAFSVSGDGWVELSNVQLDDARHESLLANADFRAGSARWFFTSDDHSSWRAENVWVHLYLEQGWLGIVSFAWLVVGTLVSLACRTSAGRDPTRYVLAVAVVGFLAMGMFGSLLDTPWISQLLCVLLAASQMDWKPGMTTPSRSAS